MLTQVYCFFSLQKTKWNVDLQLWFIALLITIQGVKVIKYFGKPYHISSTLRVHVGDSKSLRYIGPSALSLINYYKYLRSSFR